jgi:hypothetical protein
MALWDRVLDLEGKPLVTDRGQRFSISAVDRLRDAIFVTIESSKATYPIYRKSFDRVESEGLISASLRGQDLTDAKIALGRTSYVSAIVRHLAERR